MLLFVLSFLVCVGVLFLLQFFINKEKNKEMVDQPSVLLKREKRIVREREKKKRK